MMVAPITGGRGAAAGVQRQMNVTFELEAGTNYIPNISRKQEGPPRCILEPGGTMHARLAETMNYVEQKRGELLQSFQGVASDRLCRRATPDGWSVAEILD